MLVLGVVGDAIGTSRPPTTSASASATPPRIVLVFADATGRWPARGFFRSVSAYSDAPQAAYEAAHANGDLALGDAHLVPCPSGPSGPSGAPPVYVCVLVVLARSSRAAYGTAPELDLAALDTALGKLGVHARRARATVHSPRLPNTGGGNAWYAVERLLRKHTRKVPTTVYYFKR